MPSDLDRLDLSMRLASGALDPARVAVAAALGDQRAVATHIPKADLPVDLQERVAAAAQCLSPQHSLKFALEVATRALPSWTERVPLDSRPRDAIEAVRAAIEGRQLTADFQALSDAADEARVSVDYPELTEDTDMGLCRAMQAASACSHVALALTPGVVDDPAELCEIAGYVACMGVKASIDPRDEAHWQAELLIALLLE